MAMQIYTAEECPQGSEQWFRLHFGIPTGSEMFKVMAKEGPRGGTSDREYVQRQQYMRLLAAEIVTGEPREKEWFGNRHTERGKDREDEARALYALDHGVEPTLVGFVRNGNFGVSPDSLVGPNTLEMKDVLGHRQIERLQAQVLPAEHKWQVLSQLLCCENAEWADFMSHSRGLKPFYYRAYREKHTRQLAELRVGIDMFVDELGAMVNWIRSL